MSKIKKAEMEVRKGNVRTLDRLEKEMGIV